MRFLLVLLLVATVSASEVVWTRFRGRVKSVNQKASTLMVQNADGDLISLKIDADVSIISGKDEVKLADLKIDDKVTLLYQPKPPTPKDTDEPLEGGVYAPAKR